MAQIADAESGSSVRSKLNDSGIKPGNYAATTSPGASDDDSNTGGAGFNFEVGSLWVNTVFEHAFFCADATTGLAVWHRIGAVKSNGSCYISTAMVSSPGGTPIKIGTTSGATTELFTVGFSHTTPGRLVYTGPSAEPFVISANLSATHSGSNVLSSFYIAINGTIATGSQIDRKIGSGADAGALGCRWIATLNTNDFVEVFATVPSGAISVNYGVIDIALRGN